VSGGKYNSATPKKRVPKPKKKCISCPASREAEQSLDEFFKSNNIMHSDGLSPICKTCIKEKCYDKEKDDIDVDALKDILRQLDKPYNDAALQGAIDQYNSQFGGKEVPLGSRSSIIGSYFRIINSFPQYKGLDWKQGVELNNKQLSQSSNGVAMVLEDKYEPKTKQIEDERYYLDGLSDFTVTQEIINLFGEGYKKSEYKAMWDKYQFLKKSYTDVTSFHTEALITYVRFKVKEEQSVALGNVVEADKWANAARSAADKAKINPSQLSQSDLQGGINSFSELFMSIEQAEDVIPILPRFRYRPNDAIDFNILCLVNYLRELEGKPLCNYEDIYKFYDKRKEEYVEQYGDPYGIFAGDPTESNRESVKKFITLPKDYEDGDS
jgi:hypothetical protein